MRIVQAVGWYLPDSVGGTELYVGQLARCLQSQGHEVLVAAPQAGLATAHSYEINGVPVYRYPIPVSLTRAEARGDSVSVGAAEFHAWLARVKPDILHTHTFVTGLGLAEIKAAKQLGARVVSTTHAASLWFTCERGTLLHDGVALCDGVTRVHRCAACALKHRGVPNALAAGLAHIPLEASRVAARIPGRAATALAMPSLIEGNMMRQNELFAVADHLVVLSDFAARVLLANGAPPAKVVVNRLGVARDAVTTCPSGRAVRDPQRPVTVGYVGRVESIKGLDDFVHAVLSLAKSVRLRARIVAITSSPADREHLAALEATAANDSRITFDRACSQPEVWAMLGEIDVLCCPSRVVEGGPTVALEAYAVGTPVIGSALPALNEVVQHGINGALFPPGDRPALTRLLERIAANPASTIDQWRTSPHTPRTFDQVCAEYVRLYQA
ncbi:MAG TPA: glycosyltransferase [Vicinamibacterales bacterium]|nr:glycosyltransferase [Vicinamibacterales bacterium]